MYTVNDLVLQTTEAYANRIITILNFRDFKNEEALDKTFPWLTSYNSELIHSGESYQNETSDTDRAYRRRVFGEGLTNAGEAVNNLYKPARQASPEPTALTEELRAVLNKMHQAAISKIFHVRKAAQSNTQTEVSSTTSINKGEESIPVATETVEETPTVQETPAPVSSVKTETKPNTKTKTKKGQKTMNSGKQTTLNQLKANAEAELQAQTTSPVNTNTNTKTTMSTKTSNPSIFSNVVKATLTVNVTLSNTNKLSEGTIQMMANKSKDGTFITTTRGGALYADYSDGHDRVWGEVSPLPDATYDKYSNYNCAVWVLEYKDGSRRTLTHKESILFWNFLLGAQAGRSIEDYSMKVKVNFPSNITATQTKEWLSETRFRSYSITFNNVDDMFEPRQDTYLLKTKGEAGLTMIPLNADVQFQSDTKELPRPTVGIRNANSDMSSDGVIPFRLEGILGRTKSEIRRGARKEAHQVTAEVAAPISISAPSSVQEVIPAISAEEPTSTPVQVEAARTTVPAVVEVEVEAPSEPTVAVEEEVNADEPKATKPSASLLARVRQANAEAATQEVVTEEAAVVGEETPAERLERIRAERRAQAANSNRAVIDAPSAPKFVDIYDEEAADIMEDYHNC